MGWAEALWEAVSPDLPDFSVEIVAEIDSTNSELMRRARAGRDEPVLLLAERQTAGRGRLGRSWQASAGESLTFSLGLPLAPQDWSGLSLAVGVAVAEMLGPRVGLKWPNDLWVEDRKLGGILVETASFTGAAQGGRYVVIGLGLNLAARPAEGLSTPPAALQEFWPGAQTAAVMERIGAPLVRAIREFEQVGFAGFRARFESRDVLHGREVSLSDGRVGRAAGVGGQGALLVHTAAGMITLTSAEVSVRPR